MISSPANDGKQKAPENRAKYINILTVILFFTGSENEK